MCIRLFAAARYTPTLVLSPTLPTAPAFRTTRRASECFRQPSNVEFVNEANRVPLPIGIEARAAYRRKPNPPKIGCSSNEGDDVEGAVSTLITPPDALPNNE